MVNNTQFFFYFIEWAPQKSILGEIGMEEEDLIIFYTGSEQNELT